MYTADKRRGETEARGLVIVSAERLPCSASGNPRFRLYFADHGPALTQSDAAVNYDIANFLSRDRTGKPVTVVFSRAGRIVAISQDADGAEDSGHA